MRIAVILLLAPLALVACGDTPDPGDTWRTTAPETMDAPARKQRARAIAARDALFTGLSKRLMAAMQASGPEGAVQVCREAAPGVAAEVSEAHGLEIGRTSFKLRNPGNAPPAWAEPHVARREADSLYLVHPDGALRALLPITLQQTCLGCHGAAERLSEGLRATLEELYPTDAATGFEAGDLRGWFWIEVPAL